MGCAVSGNAPPDPGAPFARWLRGRAAERRMTLALLAEAVGVTPPLVSSWANGRTCPRPDALARTAAALGSEPADAPPCRRRVRT
jgi:transcriptional regulator with XRE-family HTH domain